MTTYAAMIAAAEEVARHAAWLRHNEFRIDGNADFAARVERWVTVSNDYWATQDVDAMAGGAR